MISNPTVGFITSYIPNLPNASETDTNQIQSANHTIEERGDHRIPIARMDHKDTATDGISPSDSARALGDEAGEGPRRLRRPVCLYSRCQIFIDHASRLDDESALVTEPFVYKDHKYHLRHHTTWSDVELSARDGCGLCSLSVCSKEIRMEDGLVRDIADTLTGRVTILRKTERFIRVAHAYADGATGVAFDQKMGETAWAGIVCNVSFTQTSYQGL